MAKTKRKSLSPRTRFDIFKRDGFTCQYCGQTPPAVILEVDHITPLALGGSDDQINLITSCKDCNLGKGARSLAEIPAPLDRQIKDEADRFEQLQEFNKFQLEKRRADLQSVKEITEYWNEQLDFPNAQNPFDNARILSIKMFLRRMTHADILDSIDIAHGRKPARSWGQEQYTWKYFCGVCWKKLKDREQP